MAQTLNADASCQATVDRHAVERIANGLTPCSTITGAYCKAQQRLPLAMVQPLLCHTGTLLAGQSAAAWRWQDRAVKLVDGSTVTMPDTAENQARYRQPDSQQPGLGFPIYRVVALLCLSTGAVLDTTMGPYAGKEGSEHALSHALMSSMATGDILLADRYYCSYLVIALLQARCRRRVPATPAADHRLSTRSASRSAGSHRDVAQAQGQTVLAQPGML